MWKESTEVEMVVNGERIALHLSLEYGTLWVKSTSFYLFGIRANGTKLVCAGIGGPFKVDKNGKLKSK